MKKNIAEGRHCSYYGRAVSWFMDMKARVERSRFLLATVVISIILLLGIAWFVRMDTGLRWPLYVLLICAAPCVPWLLQLAYKAAAPLK